MRKSFDSINVADNIPNLDKHPELNDILLSFVNHSNLELQQSSISVLNNLLAVSGISNLTKTYFAMIQNQKIH